MVVFITLSDFWRDLPGHYEVNYSYFNGKSTHLDGMDMSVAHYPFSTIFNFSGNHLKIMIIPSGYLT